MIPVILVLLGIVAGASAMALWFMRKRVVVGASIDLRVRGEAGIYVFGLVCNNVAYAFDTEGARQLESGLRDALARIDAMEVARLRAHIAEHLAVSDDEVTRVAQEHQRHVELQAQLRKGGLE
jgi:hypothetical protein